MSFSSYHFCSTVFLQSFWWSKVQVGQVAPSKHIQSNIVPTIQKKSQKKTLIFRLAHKNSAPKKLSTSSQKKTLPKNLWSPMARPTLQSTITESFTVLTCTSSCASSSATHVRCAPIAIEVTSGLHRRNLGANVWTGRSLKTKDCWRFAKSDNIQKQMVTGGQKLGIVRHRRIWDLHTPQNRQYLI